MKWIILLAGIANLIFACLIIRRAPQTYFKHYFSIFIFIAVGWIFSNFALINFLSFFWLRTTYALGALVVAAALVWVIGFKNEQKPLPFLFLCSCYGVGFIFFGFCFLSKIFLKDIAIEATVVKVVYGLFFPVYFIFTIVVMLFLLLRTLQYALIFKGAKRTQARYIFLGLLGYILVTTFGALVLPLFGWPQFAFLDSPSSLFFIGFTTYAITKHRLMDISVVISRGVAEILTVLFHGTIYLALVWLYRAYVSISIDFPFLFLTILYGILVGQTHQRVRLFIQTTSDKLFLRGKYDYYRELSEMSSQITRSLSQENILQTLHRIFYEVIEVSNPRIYLSEDLSKPEVKNLISTKEPTFDKDDLILPCIVEDRLMVLIVLGKKLSEDPYTDEDLRLLKNLANQTAVALDHQRMYEEMLKTQEQLLMADKLASLGNVAADLAQEIRNPLLTIRKAVQETDWNVNDPEFIRSFKEVIPKEIDRLNSLVDNLLRMAKVPIP